MSRKDKEGFNQPFGELAKLKTEPAPTTLSGLAKLARKAPAPVVPRREVSDAELFANEMAGTAPIERRVSRVGAPAPSPRPVRKVSDDGEVLAMLADLCDGNGLFDISDTDEYIEGVAEGVDRKLLRRLRAGEYAVQAHVDLHGLTRDEARDKVVRFLADSRKAGHRCVLMVHGRGLHSKDNIPILKQAVRAWLERGQVSRMVLAFATALPTDGGAGAVYVLLRR